MFKKPMGFVKKTRTQVGSSAISQVVGVTGTGFSANTNATSSPQGKKKKQKSVSSAIVGSGISTKGITANVMPSQGDFSPTNGQDSLFLPHTGVEYPFLKKRPHFITEGPEYELVHSGVSNMRFIGGTGSNSIQHSLAQRPTDYNSRLVYDCTFGVGHGAVGALTSAGSQLLGSNNLVSGGTQVNGQIINGRYFDKLSNYYNLKSNSDVTLLFESRFESGNLHRAT
jgi:hypothetical protein